ncbi:GYD domain-containing protein [Bradyrhizobium sp. CB2312]|uniref:GYD domain-containing protein n=1 Tax=Bradyrhizobium sp. CB2312 TaxID=3039155 RepID=UPI0024B1A0D8|nr:GYD domain-containing protein [Bradyrhizobium sp. CB2312]WFU70101.1 GYD domain-containing protein [Bradyrhizobium sp. CB2312]
MSTYMLLCNFTEQGVRTIREMPQRRAAARELGKKFGVDIKAGYLAMGTYDLIIHAEAADDEAMAKFLLSLAAIGNVRTTSVKVFPEADVDKIIGGLA